ncbi:hypothetical protein GGS20DRAFT_581556 [Poronia punctata]|nr:hypothetical protein GGS20DRAFT_581556 [Poronia punctata]
MARQGAQLGRRFLLIPLLTPIDADSPVALKDPSTAAFLTVDTSNLAIPAKLSGSVFLRDLSKVSGNDLPSSIGFTLSPVSDLKLGNTAAQQSFSPETFAQLRSYRGVSTFVAVAFIMAFVSNSLSCVSSYSHVGLTMPVSSVAFFISPQSHLKTVARMATSGRTWNHTTG